MYKNIPITNESIRINFGNRFIAFACFKTLCSLATCLIEKTKK